MNFLVKGIFRGPKIKPEVSAKMLTVFSEIWLPRKLEKSRKSLFSFKEVYVIKSLCKKFKFVRFLWIFIFQDFLQEFSYGVGKNC